MRVTLDYGMTGLTVDIPDRVEVAVLGLQRAIPLADPVRAVAEALEHPIGSPPLREVARGRKSACVAVCDITRPVPNTLVLPPLLRTVEAAGVPAEAITLLVATGVHRPNQGAELERMLGAELLAKYPVVNHVARDLASHRFLGSLPCGAPLYLDARYCDADLKIVTGLVEPHFMAGFSGGRKVICPGIAALETVKHFHATRLLEHPCAETGVVAGNPVHAFAQEAARIAGVDFAVNVTIDEERRLTGVFAGELEASWLAGVAHAREVVTAPLDAPADIVLTSSAGYPLDATYYQAVKGMVGALPAVKPGGTIVLAARMAEGVGSPEFTRLLLESNSLEELVERVRNPQHFVIDQWEVVELAKALAKAEVLCFTEGVDAETLRRAYAIPVSSVEEGLARALGRHGVGARLAVIPKGPYVIPVVSSPARD